MHKDINIDELVDFVSDCAEYIYDWASSYTGKYTPVDHRDWYNHFLILIQEYNFDLEKIKEDIKSNKIILHTFKNDNPKFLALYSELYKKHKQNVKKFEKKYKIS